MLTQEAAEAIGLQALAWLVANEDLLPVFMDASGATDPGFLGAVLDFVMMDDAWVIAFCDTLRMPYERVMQARQSLPGGEQVNWT